MGRGFTVVHIYSGQLTTLRIALPQLEEQTTIATFLDRETAKIDALIAEQQRPIELLAEKRQAVISHAVTKGLDPTAPMKDSGVEWLGKVPEHWAVVPLKHLTNPERQVMYGIVLPGPNVEEGIPIVKGGDVRPFHVYTMRQAIEEDFILDVLRNYTSYKMAFKLTHNGREVDDQKVEADEAMKRIMGWVRLHPFNIASRVQIVVEHFRENVAHLLNGQAKAMVVTGSRKEAVRWMTGMQKYIEFRGYRIGLLVAFSGEVTDPETGPDPFSEPNMNPGLRGRDIRDAFDTPEYSILLVANKFQTGFDQPLLCAMYVDKRLGGIQAVQTLSRLNRAHPGKDTTYVVDFVNDPDEVLTAFKVYHTTAELSGVTDPAVLLDLRAKLDGQARYDTFEVERVVKVSLKSGATQKDLQAALAPVADRLLRQYREAKERFKNAPDGSQDAKAAKDTMDALAAHQTMSKQALESEQVRSGLKDLLLGPIDLWAALRDRAGGRAEEEAIDRSVR